MWPLLIANDNSASTCYRSHYVGLMCIQNFPIWVLHIYNIAYKCFSSTYCIPRFQSTDVYFRPFVISIMYWSRWFFSRRLYWLESRKSMWAVTTCYYYRWNQDRYTHVLHFRHFTNYFHNSLIHSPLCYRHYYHFVMHWRRFIESQKNARKESHVDQRDIEIFPICWSLILILLLKTSLRLDISKRIHQGAKNCVKAFARLNQRLW